MDYDGLQEWQLIKMNILILAAGTRNKIVQYFKNAVGGGW